MAKLKYKRVLVKISGEALAGKNDYGIDPEMANYVANELIDLKKAGAEVAVVIGGGNIFRGYTASTEGMDRSTADYMGMIATIMNALALQDSMEKKEEYVRVMTALTIPSVAEPYIRRKAIRYLEKGISVIFGGGSGNPYFSTDTAAVLRALEIDADLIIKATKVDGVYNKDPHKHDSAEKHHKLKFIDLLNSGLEVMDSTATSLCMDNDMPMIVLNLLDKGSIKKAVQGEEVGTLITVK